MNRDPSKGGSEKLKWVHQLTEAMHLSTKAMAVLTVLVAHADYDDGTEARPARSTMVRKTSLSPSSVDRALDELVQKAVIRRTGTHGEPGNTVNVYAVNYSLNPDTVGVHRAPQEKLSSSVQSPTPGLRVQADWSARPLPPRQGDHPDSPAGPVPPRQDDDGPLVTGTNNHPPDNHHPSNHPADNTAGNNTLHHHQRPEAEAHISDAAVAEQGTARSAPQPPAHCNDSTGAVAADAVDQAPGQSRTTEISDTQPADGEQSRTEVASPLSPNQDVRTPARRLRIKRTRQTEASGASTMTNGEQRTDGNSEKRTATGGLVGTRRDDVIRSLKMSGYLKPGRTQLFNAIEGYIGCMVSTEELTQLLDDFGCTYRTEHGQYFREGYVVHVTVPPEAAAPP